MTDFTFDKEEYEERAAIMEYDGKLSRNQAESLARHECEVRWCVKQFYPDGEKMKRHFMDVEKIRGKEATDKLRDDVRRLWQEKMAFKRSKTA